MINWSNIFSGIDINDIQCDHVWDMPTDTCKLCNKNWNEILWNSGKPCCSGGLDSAFPAQYSGGKWHNIDCDTLKPPLGLTEPQNDHRPAASKKGICTCGSAAVGSDRHSSWCDVK